MSLQEFGEIWAFEFNPNKKDFMKLNERIVALNFKSQC